MSDFLIKMSTIQRNQPCVEINYDMLREKWSPLWSIRKRERTYELKKKIIVYSGKPDIVVRITEQQYMKIQEALSKPKTTQKKSRTTQTINGNNYNVKKSGNLIIYTSTKKC